MLVGLKCVLKGGRSWGVTEGKRGSQLHKDSGELLKGFSLRKDRIGFCFKSASWLALWDMAST